MFPISDRRGDVIAFGGRLLRGDGPKYINSPETPLYRKREALYGIHLALQPIRKQQQVVICEGYMDVIALHQSGVEHSVAPLGTAFTTEQAVFLKRYAETATLLFDADRAGVQASRKTAEVLEQQGVAPAVVVLDEGQDPADLMLSGGSQAVLNAVSSPLPILEFLVQKGRETGAGSSPVAKERISHELFGYIELIGSEVKREESLRHVSDLLGVDFAAVHTDFLQWRRTAASSSKKKQETRREVPSDSTRSGQSRLTHDLFLMLATVHSRDHYALVRKWVQPEDLEDDDAREVYLALEESFRRGETSLELLLQRITKPTVMKLVQERVATGEFEEQTDAVVHDTINAIRRRSILKQLAAVERELRRLSASSTGSSASERELLTEKMSLDRELQKIKGDGE
jgi:DNA primase